MHLNPFLPLNGPLAGNLTFPQFSADGAIQSQVYARRSISGETSTSGTAAWGTITGTLSSQTDLQTALNAKQETLVSSTNIKTINGASILGSGDLVVSGAAKRTIGMVFDGGGSPPTIASVGYIVAQFSGTIDQWSVVSDVSGSAVIDVWKAAGAIPTIANTIAGSEKPTLSSQQLNSDTSLTTWTTTVTAGDVFGFSIDSVTTCTRLTVEVRIQES